MFGPFAVALRSEAHHIPKCGSGVCSASPLDPLGVGGVLRADRVIVYVYERCWPSAWKCALAVTAADQCVCWRTMCWPIRVHGVKFAIPISLSRSATSGPVPRSRGPRRRSDDGALPPAPSPAALGSPAAPHQVRSVQMCVQVRGSTLFFQRVVVHFAGWLASVHHARLGVTERVTLFVSA